MFSTKCLFLLIILVIFLKCPTATRRTVLLIYRAHKSEVGATLTTNQPHGQLDIADIMDLLLRVKVPPAVSPSWGSGNPPEHPGPDRSGERWEEHRDRRSQWGPREAERWGAAAPGCRRRRAERQAPQPQRRPFLLWLRSMYANTRFAIRDLLTFGLLHQVSSILAFLKSKLLKLRTFVGAHTGTYFKIKEASLRRVRHWRDWLSTGTWTQHRRPVALTLLIIL